MITWLQVLNELLFAGFLVDVYQLSSSIGVFMDKAVVRVFRVSREGNKFRYRLWLFVSFVWGLVKHAQI